MLKMFVITIFVITLAAFQIFSPERASMFALIAIICSFVIDRGMPICMFVCVDMMNIEVQDSIQAALLLLVGLVAISILVQESNKVPQYKKLIPSLFFFSLISFFSFIAGYHSTIMYFIRSLYVFIIAFAIGFHFCGKNIKILSFTFLSSGLAVMGIVMYQLLAGTMQMEFDAETGRLTYGEQVRTLSNALAFPIYYSFIEYMQAIEKKEVFKRSYWLVFVLLGTTLLLFTMSRGVIVAVGITLVYVFLSRIKNVRKSTLLLTTLFAALIIYYISTLELNTEYMFNRVESLTGRDEIWGYYLGRVFNGGPLSFLFGFGPGDIKRLSVGTSFADAYEHSLFVGFFVSFGIIGFAYLLWVLFKVGRPLWRSKSKYDFGMFLMTILLFVPFGAALKPLFYYLIGLCLALSMSDLVKPKTERNEKQISW